MAFNSCCALEAILDLSSAHSVGSFALELPAHEKLSQLHGEYSGPVTGVL